jgi:ribonuclease E
MSEDTLPETSGANPAGAAAISDTYLPASASNGNGAAEPEGGADTDAPDAAGEASGDGAANPRPLGPDGLPRPRRRRGSRGGRNRKRPAGTGSTSGGATADDDAVDAALDNDADDDVAPTPVTGRAQRGHDWNDADADGGYTDDDALIEAREEAGLPEPGARPQIGDRRPAPPRPQVGDSRPSSPSASPGPARDGEANGEGGPKKRRRRRGGRGRSRTGSDAGTGTNGSGAPNGGRSSGPTPSRPKPSYVEGSLAADDGEGETSILDLLDDEMLEKRRGLTRKGRPTGRYAMVVRTKPNGVSQIAVLEGRNLIEHYVSEPEDDIWSIDGNIYLGRVQNVLPGMEAAFIDIGTPKNGVLYQGDVAFDASEVDGGEKPRIERVLRNGQAIIVQVTKNPIGHKGARLTQEVSLAGRFVVMVPAQPDTYGISKRLPDDERKRLRRILDHLRPDDAGLIVRTAAEGATEEELERDMRRLRAQWAQISALAKQAKTGRLLYKEPPLVTRVIREEFTKEYRAIVNDDRALYEDE